MRWYLAVLRRYATFRGRAGRSEFWWFSLWNLVIGLALSVIELALGLGTDYWGPLGAVYALAVFLPGLAVGTRRLHDIDRTGWLQLLLFVPIIGLIVLIIFWVQRGDAAPNEFGPAPAGVAEGA